MNTAGAEATFRSFVEEPVFPCLAAKGLVRQRGYTLGVYGSIGSFETTASLASDLTSFVARTDVNSSAFTAFVAVFRGRPQASEDIFERALWDQLGSLHEMNMASDWDESVSHDPESPRFAFSFAGRAFFVVGMHPLSSRIARQFPRTALVFNPHSQFEQLRAEGRFDRLRTAIRERDLAVQEQPNPALADFGSRSEARQYSGKVTGPEWRCPFHPRPPE